MNSQRLLKEHLGPHFLRVNSRDNTFQRLEVLKRNRKARAKYSLCLVESVAAIKAAHRFKWEFQSLCFPYERDLSDWALGMLKECSAERIGLSNTLMNELSDKQDGSELIAVVKTKEDVLSRISVKEDSVVVVLDRPTSPGNLGSTIRSADAFSASGVIVVGHAADIYDPVAIRSSVGALFSTSVVRTGSPDEVLTWLRSHTQDVTILGTSAQGRTPAHARKFKKPLALIFGNETYGMSKRFEEICDDLLCLPMNGVASSINVSCAASIFLYLAHES